MIHKHLLVRGRGKTTLSPDEAADLLRQIIDAVGMRLVDVPGNPLVYDCSVVGNEGVTVNALVVDAVIETSHCVLHTWTTDVHNLTLFQFDLYSCAYFDPLKVCQMLKDRLDFVSFERMLIDRTTGLQHA